MDINQHVHMLLAYLNAGRWGEAEKRFQEIEFSYQFGTGKRDLTPHCFFLLMSALRLFSVRATWAVAHGMPLPALPCDACSKCFMLVATWSQDAEGHDQCPHCHQTRAETRFPETSTAQYSSTSK